MKLTHLQIVERAQEAAVLPKQNTALEILASQEVGQRLLRLSGYGYYPIQQFQDAFERMTPERAFAIYVLAQALDDIEPVDTHPPLGFSPAKLTQLFAAQDQARRNRITRLQEIEARHRREGVALIREYRHKLRERKQAEVTKTLTATYRHAYKFTPERLRHKYKAKLRSFQTLCEERDPTNASLEWFLTERGMVEFWCHMADVSAERCYLAVERRLLSLGRCSIPLRAFLKELRKGRTWDYEVELNPLNWYENRAWQAWTEKPNTGAESRG